MNGLKWSSNKYYDLATLVPTRFGVPNDKSQIILGQSEIHYTIGLDRVFIEIKLAYVCDPLSSNPSTHLQST